MRNAQQQYQHRCQESKPGRIKQLLHAAHGLKVTEHEATNSSETVLQPQCQLQCFSTSRAELSDCYALTGLRAIDSNVAKAARVVQLHSQAVRSKLVQVTAAVSCRDKSARAPGAQLSDQGAIPLVYVKLSCSSRSRNSFRSQR